MLVFVTHFLSFCTTVFLLSAQSWRINNESHLSQILNFCVCLDKIFIMLHHHACMVRVRGFCVKVRIASLSL
uniref:Putative secreted protein n=1 Tax=Anopheles triannulatus TaxID=58253 RepID=A0A2M4B3W6_9DIPT